MVGITQSGFVSGSGYISQGKVKSTYTSVNDISGIGAGTGGYNIYVGGNTDLNGAVITSTADPAKNVLDTGTLSFENLHNVSEYDAKQTTVSGGSTVSSNIAGAIGAGLSLAVPQGANDSSDTKAGIAQGTITVRDNPDQDLTGLDRNPTLDNQALKNSFDLQKVQTNQQIGAAAGYVAMHASGDIEDALGMQTGSAGSVALHTIAGGAIAGLAGGSAAQGALGAGTSEAAAGVLQDYLQNPNSPAGKSLMNLASAAIGGVVGGGAGAATAIDGELYNRELHPDETSRLADLQKGKSPEEQQRLADAACALVLCADGVPDTDPNKAQLVASQQRGQSYTDEQAQLWTGDSFQYTTSDAIADFSSRNQLGTRSLGVVQAVGGAVQATTAGVLAATTCETGFGCFVAGYMFVGGVDNYHVGWDTAVNGAPTPTWGGQVLQSFGAPPIAAELIYGATQMAPSAVEAYTANGAVNTWIASNTAVREANAGASPLGVAENTAKEALPESVASNVGSPPKAAVSSPPVVTGSEALEGLFGQTVNAPELSHTSGLQNCVLGEQVAFQVLQEQTGMTFAPLQNASGNGADGVYIDHASNTVWVAEVKSSQNGVDAAADAAGDPAVRLRDWLAESGDPSNGSAWKSQPASNEALAKQLQDAINDGYQVKGVQMKVGIPKPGGTGVPQAKITPWTSD